MNGLPPVVRFPFLWGIIFVAACILLPIIAPIGILMVGGVMLSMGIITPIDKR